MLKGFGSFWYDFVIGDDWHIAAGVCAVLFVGVVAVVVGVTSVWLGPVLAIGFVGTFAWGVLAR